MRHFERILLCTDFSDSCENAAARARMLKHCCGAELTLVHVINYVPPAYMGVELPPMYTSTDDMEESARNHLSEWANAHELSDCQQVVETGSVKKKIVEIADQMGVDLVVLGAHGDSGIARMFGSVAHSVAQHVSCDALVVR